MCTSSFIHVCFVALFVSQVQGQTERTKRYFGEPVQLKSRALYFTSWKYRLTRLASITDARVADRTRARQQELSGKTGGDSVFTLYVTANMDKSYFARIASAHFFYTPSAAGVSSVHAWMNCGPARPGSPVTRRVYSPG